MRKSDEIRGLLALRRQLMIPCVIVYCSFGLSFLPCEILDVNCPPPQPWCGLSSPAQRRFPAVMPLRFASRMRSHRPLGQ